ncbi:MAG: VOC family protein [Dehalococcoidia bacterium]|nr:VOC family protein [Dehalococcoidia bacterium]
MAILGIQYFSIAVNDIDAAVERYVRAFGLKKRTEVQDTRWGFKNCMVGTDEGNLIEVIAPSQPDSALARFMKMREGPAYPGGEGIYLVGMRVEDTAAQISMAAGQGLKVTTEPDSPTSAWIHPATNGNVMLEFNQAQPPA